MTSFEVTLQLILVGLNNRNIVRIKTELSSFGVFRKGVVWTLIQIVAIFCHLDVFAQRTRRS